jgi:hypothetical protein
MGKDYGYFLLQKIERKYTSKTEQKIIKVPKGAEIIIKTSK